MPNTNNTSMRSPPPRGFSTQEFEQRTQRAQQMMHRLQLDVLLLTTEPEVRYFSGFFTQFWLSPTRPWFLLLPLEGKPIAIIPNIGVVGMQQTWLDDIRSWSAPHPEDDGISLLTAAIDQLPKRYARIGVPMGPETHLRMPAQDFDLLRNKLSSFQMVDCGRLLQTLCVSTPQMVRK